jgi:hypothetical protein
LLIPFGIFGFGAFLWFCGAALSVLVKNLRYGDPALHQINTFLLAYFVGRFLFYMIFYGQFDTDFLHFIGTVGLSISLNGGVCSAEEPEIQSAPVGALATAAT